MRDLCHDCGARDAVDRWVVASNALTVMWRAGPRRRAGRRDRPRPHVILGLAIRGPCPPEGDQRIPTGHPRRLANLETVATIIARSAGTPATAAAPAPRRPGLAAQALQRLEEMIVTLELAPGSMWSEGALAAHTGFGRTPVREALKQLEGRHLVRIVQRHGVQITEINVEQQLLLLETRRELERLLASRAARRRNATEATQAAECAADLRAAGDRGDVLDFFRTHARAEALAVQAARNPFLATAIAPCRAMSRRFYFLHHRTANDLKLACDHHADVMDAIARGDEPAAMAAADAVLDYVEGFTRATLTEGF
jgi:DNA-binding GntR family transcriptional regulator